METHPVVSVVDRLRAAHRTGKTLPLAWRTQQLRRLRDLLDDHEPSILEALAADLGKPTFEAYGTEVGFAKAEVAYALAHLAKWMKPERARTPVRARLLNFWSRSRIQREPLGVVLIIGPWNYPLQLTLGPLVGALAAGNCAVVKPSELAPRTSAAVAELIQRYLDPDCVQVIEGGADEAAELIEQRFDHVFFTGSTRVGRIVARAAAENLTPVTLELGGKSPCLVDRDVQLDVAARRIVWGKFLNAGQSCVAPDYVLAHKAIEPALTDALARVVRAFYGDDPQKSPDLARIVSDDHVQRLTAFFGDGEVVVGGRADPADRYVAPTVLRGVDPDAPVMREEIFGPVLPVVAVDDLDAAIDFVNARPKPLALYVFSRDPARARHVLAHTRSGGACVNDTVSHLADPGLPFGGVGASGMGAYHGRHGFECFSHRKGVLDRATWVDLQLRYPPISTGALRLVRRLLG